MSKARLALDVDFDPFSLMQASDTTCAFNQGYSPSTIDTLIPKVSSFFDSHPDLLGYGEQPKHLETADRDGLKSVESISEDTDQHGQAISSVSQDLGAPPGFGYIDKYSLGQGLVALFPEGGFLKWLSNLYDSDEAPTIEMGSLAFFRHSAYQTIMDYFDADGGLGFDASEEVAFQTIAAGILLQLQSVWTFPDGTLPIPAKDENLDFDYSLEEQFHLEQEHVPEHEYGLEQEYSLEQRSQNLEQACRDLEQEQEEPKLVVFRSDADSLYDMMLSHIFGEYLAIAENLEDYLPAVNPGLASGNTQINEVERYELIDYEGSFEPVDFWSRSVQVLVVVYFTVMTALLPSVCEHTVLQLTAYLTSHIMAVTFFALPGISDFVQMASLQVYNLLHM